MNPNCKLSKINVNSPWQCDDVQNNCDKCGKLYRYNWRRRRTRDKTCSLCVNEVKCDVNTERHPNPDSMNFDPKPEDDLLLDKRTCDAPLPILHTPEPSPDPLNPFALHDFTDHLLQEMRAEFGEELRNPHKGFKSEFEWPSTRQLSKVDCLRAFNIMKQILLREMGKCGEASGSEAVVAKRKFYLERRFQSLEKEKIRRLKIYESLYIQEEVKNGYEYLCKT